MSYKNNALGIKMLVSVLFFLHSHLIAQNVEQLDERNGFKDIKMTSSILNYDGLEFKKPPCTQPSLCSEDFT